jgi:hypothetical protein
MSKKIMRSVRTSEKIAGPPHTKIYSNGHNTIAEFRDRELVRVNYTDVRLDMQGHRDVITYSRLNQLIRLLHLDCHLRRHEGIWVVETAQETYLFQDGMHLIRSAGRDHEYIRYEAKPPR